MIPINTQKAQKREMHPLGWLWVHSIFYTIQGEGPFAGRPAVFVRLAGCNLQCPGCDTEYTKVAILMDAEHILSHILEEMTKQYVGSLSSEKLCPIIVITGGEPFRQNLLPLLDKLTRYRYTVQIETNGTLWDEALSEIACREELHIVCSPKAGRVAIPGHLLTALKYVLDADHISAADGLPTSVLGLPAAPARPPQGFKGILYVQPADESGGPELHQTSQAANARNLHATINSAMKYGYTLCIQMHKIIGMD